MAEAIMTRPMSWQENAAAAERSRGMLPVLAYVVNSLNAGGTEKLAFEMSLAFAAEFGVHVFCLDEPGRWAVELRDRGVAVHCLWRQPGFDTRMASRLASALRACGARIVHAHQCTPWLYAALSRLRYPTPRLLLEEHGRFFPEPDNRVRRAVNRALIRRLTHRFVAVSDDVRNRLRRYEGLDGVDIDVIYNGVAPSTPLTVLERAALRQELGFGTDSFVVGTVGRFDPIKNLPMLGRALAIACERNPRVRGLLIGDGPDLGVMRALVEQLGLGSRVSFTGFRGDAHTLAKCMDLFVLSSFSEGISVALLEAISAGVPVAVTAVGGNPEVVVSEETGWVVPSNATEVLAAAILEAADSPARCDDLARAGRRRLEERFTFDRMIASYRRLYCAMISSSG